MTAFIFIASYAMLGLGVGKLWANIFLNKEYQYRVSRGVFIESSHAWRYNHDSYEDYLVANKEKAYEYALEESDFDRKMAMVVSLLGWPLTIFVVVGHYLFKLANKVPRRGLGFSAAARDVRKAQKQVLKLKAERELENKRIQEWNQMVDVIKTNNLDTGGIVFEKKKLLK